MKYKRVASWLLISGLALGMSSTGCSPGSSPNSPVAETTAPIVEGAEPTAEQRERMLAAKDALFQQLSGRLMEVMGTAGPVAAIGVCHKEAPRIAQEVGQEHGVEIGRVGVRLRNPQNTAPGWAQAWVEQHVDTPQFARLDNGHAVGLLPIKLQAQCTICHGPKEQIGPEIQAQLDKLYPEDAATGFREGELRGWFWIELPAS